MATGIRLYFMPSLMRIAAIKTAVLLWKQIKTSSFVWDPNKPSQPKSFCDIDTKWQEIEDEVKGNISHLMLPEPVVAEVKCLIKPIGKQIWKWFFNHEASISSSISLIDKFYWTTQGSIDMKKTAELLVKNGLLDAIESFNLACEYCLENDIPVLWDSALENGENPEFFRRPPILCKFWVFLITNDVEAMNSLNPENRYSPFQLAFIIAAVQGNIAATQHFWSKLSADEKNESLVEAAQYVCFPDRRLIRLYGESHGHVMRFLLSKMTKDEQSELFKTETLGVLLFFAHWPLQDILVETVRFVLQFLDEDVNEDDLDIWRTLLNFFIRRQSADCSNCVFKQVFTDLWLQMPVEVRKSLVIGLNNYRYASEGDLLWLLLKHRDVRNIKLFLAEASPELRRKILLSRQGSFNCKTLIDADNLALLEFFVRQCASSKEDFVQWKQELELFYSKKGEEEAGKNVIDKINAIFDPMK